MPFHQLFRQVALNTTPSEFRYRILSERPVRIESNVLDDQGRRCVLVAMVYEVFQPPHSQDLDLVMYSPGMEDVLYDLRSNDPIPDRILCRPGVINVEFIAPVPEALTFTPTLTPPGVISAHSSPSPSTPNEDANENQPPPSQQNHPIATSENIVNDINDNDCEPLTHNNTSEINDGTDDAERVGEDTEANNDSTEQVPVTSNLLSRPLKRSHDEISSQATGEDHDDDTSDVQGENEDNHNGDSDEGYNDNGGSEEKKPSKIRVTDRQEWETFLSDAHDLVVEHKLDLELAFQWTNRDLVTLRAALEESGVRYLTLRLGSLGDDATAGGDDTDDSEYQPGTNVRLRGRKRRKASAASSRPAPTPAALPRKALVDLLNNPELVSVRLLGIATFFLNRISSIPDLAHLRKLDMPDAVLNVHNASALKNLRSILRQCPGLRKLTVACPETWDHSDKVFRKTLEVVHTVLLDVIEAWAETEAFEIPLEEELFEQARTDADSLPRYTFVLGLQSRPDNGFLASFQHSAEETSTNTTVHCLTLLDLEISSPRQLDSQPHNPKILLQPWETLFQSPLFNNLSDLVLTHQISCCLLAQELSPAIPNLPHLDAIILRDLTLDFRKSQSPLLQFLSLLDVGSFKASGCTFYGQVWQHLDHQHPCGCESLLKAITNREKLSQLIISKCSWYQSPEGEEMDQVAQESLLLEALRALPSKNTASLMTMSWRTRAGRRSEYTDFE